MVTVTRALACQLLDLLVQPGQHRLVFPLQEEQAALGPHQLPPQLLRPELLLLRPLPHLAVFFLAEHRQPAVLSERLGVLLELVRRARPGQALLPAGRGHGLLAAPGNPAGEPGLLQLLANYLLQSAAGHHLQYAPSVIALPALLLSVSAMKKE